MSEPRGVFKPVDFLYALNHTERFAENRGQGKLLGLHKDLARNVVSKAAASNLPLKDGFADMFLYQDQDGTYKVVDVLGQMEPKAMPYEGIRAAAETFAARAVEALGSDIKNDLNRGIDFATQIYNTKIDQAARDRLTVVANASLSEVDVNGIAKGNQYGAPDLDALEGDASLTPDSGFLPPGFGSVAGLYTIAAASPESRVGAAIGKENITVARKFTAAVNALHGVASGMFSKDHMAFSAKSVPNHFKSSYAEVSQAGEEINSRIAFAQSLIDTNKAPLYYSGSGAGVSNMTSQLEDIEGASESEQAIIEGLRTAAAANASPATRSAFSDASSIQNFRASYEQSPFASAYGRMLAQRATDPEQAASLRENKSFELFATTYLGEMIEPGTTSVASIGAVLNGVVHAVNTKSSLNAGTIDSTLQRWASNARSVSTSAAASSMPGSSMVMTRLVASPTAIANATGGATGFSVADPRDVSRTLNLSDRVAVSNAEATSRASLTTLFAHSEASPIRMAAGAQSLGSTSMFAQSGAVFDTNVGGVIQGDGFGGGATVTKNLDANFAQATQERDPLVRLGAQLITLAPAQRDTFERLYRADVRVPVSILGERPLRRYEAASAIFAAGGEQLGMIAWSKYDVHLESNAMTKEFGGNASIWAAAVVKRDERYFLAEDVIVTGYLGGESLDPFTRESFRPEQLNSDSASVFYFLVPYGCLRGPESVSRTHDIRGFYSPDLIEQRLTPAARGVVTDRMHYPSALYYTQQVYKFGRLRVLSMEETDYYKVDGRRDNTVTHQTMQWLWHPKTGKHSEAIMNTDHFGQNIYEGHGDLRVMGASKHYKDMNYNFAPVD